jgi:hypothetical protein
MVVEPVWEDLDEKSYLGYVNIRPQVPGLVGRTMLTPPLDIRDAVRTAVKERVRFFGRQLEVKSARG